MQNISIITGLRVASVVLGLAAATLPAQAATIFSEDFNGYSAGGFGTQADTGLQVGAYGSLAGWNAYGINANHAVNRDSAGDWGLMFYGYVGGGAPGANGIEMIDGVAANALGTTYEVSFEGAGATFASSSQANRAGDTLYFRLIDELSNEVASFTYDPTDWTDDGINVFASSSFSYLGTGTGLVRLSVFAVTTFDHFGGALDNLAISSVATDVPEPASALLLLGGLGLLASRRRRAAR